MKKILVIAALLLSIQLLAQPFPVTGVTITAPANPDANTANWKSGAGMLTISATGRMVNGVIDGRVKESRILVVIKKNGAVSCGSFNSSSAPASNFSTVSKVWSGNNAVSLLGQECVLPPGDYELCVQFFGEGAAPTPMSEEKCKAFSIKAKDDQKYQPPQPLLPANNASFTLDDVKKPVPFKWAPVVPRPAEPVTYRLKVWQLMEGQNSTQAMKVNQPVITKDIDNLTQYNVTNILTGPCKPPYLCDFIWSVQALNRDGKPIGENNGTGEAYAFTIANINGCPRKNVPFYDIDIELNKVSHCAVLVNGCASYNEITTSEIYNIWNGPPTHNFTIAEQNTLMADARQWAMDNRPAGCNNSQKSIISITYIKDYLVGDEDMNYCFVRIVVQYGCCTGITNSYSAMQINLSSPANNSTLRSEKNTAFVWSPSSTPPEGTTYRIKIVELKGDESPEQALRTNKPFFEKDSLNYIVFNYPPDAPRLKEGNKYAWNVQVSGAKSNAFVFSMQKNEPGTTSIELLSPSGKTEPVNTRPTFEWKTSPAMQTANYSLVLREVEEGKEITGGKVIFDKKGITGNSFRFPNEVRSLDSTRTYSWELKMVDQNDKIISGGVAVFRMMPLPPPGCTLYLLGFQPYVFGGSNKFCEGGNTPTGINVVYLDGGPTNTVLNWTLADGSGNITSGTYITIPSYAVQFTIPLSPPPTAPGIYNYSLTVTRGGCSKTINFSVIIYPNVAIQVLDYPSGSPITSLCWGEDAVLRMDGVPQNCNVLWEYSLNGGSSWNAMPGGGTGNPYNTNPVNWFPCSGPSRTVHFRGTVQNCGNSPAPWPAACSDKKIISLQVFCPSVAGSISVSSSSHIIQAGNKICSNNNYPVSLSLALGGYTGSITGWTRNPGSIPASTNATISDLITAAGTYTYTATVQNNGCASKTAQVTIVIEDPITASVSSNKTEVCWGDDASLTLTHNGPPGTQVTWQYSLNCTGPWLNSGVISVVQNTNELFGPSFPSVVPPTLSPCNPNKICWRAIVTSPTGICSPVVTSPVTINVIVPPTAPVITPAGPIVKCWGAPVTLTTSTPVCGGSPITYQWYLNGLPVGSGQSFQATEPGNYFVVAHNKNNCDSIQSTNVVTVRDCITKVIIEGPCTCSPNMSFTLTANASSLMQPPGTTPATCGGPYSYLWSTGATTQSINMGCPLQTTTVWVEVTNAMGCVTKVFHTIKKCN
jgi:hypothetical protein